MLSLNDFAIAFALITMILAIGIWKDKMDHGMEGDVRRQAGPMGDLPIDHGMKGYVTSKKYYAKLVSLTKVGNDYMGRPTAVLTYKIRNHDMECFYPFDVTVKAFQEGKQLEPAYLTSTDVPGGYDAESSLREIHPGCKRTVTVGYVLENDDTPVTVEMSGTTDMPDKKVTGQFFLA